MGRDSSESAFPTASYNHITGKRNGTVGGLTKREYYAGQVLQAMAMPLDKVVDAVGTCPDDDIRKAVRDIAGICFSVADVMIQESKQ